MYLTGQIWDFESRMHQLAQSSGDLTNFKIEGSGYLAGGSHEQLRDRWGAIHQKTATSVVPNTSYAAVKAFKK